MRLPIDSEIPQSHINDEEDDKGSNIDKTVTSLLQSRDPEEAFRKAEQNIDKTQMNQRRPMTKRIYKRRYQLELKRTLHKKGGGAA